jgi:hypothetical protein
MDEKEEQRLKALLETEPYREAKPLMITTFERGKLEGKLEGRLEGSWKESSKTAVKRH